MRTIRVAESRDREIARPATVRAGRRPRDLVATAPILLLVPALALPILATQASSTVGDTAGAGAAESCVVIRMARFDPPGRDVTRLNREAVVLENRCGQTIDLDGWVIQDRNGENTYRFRDRRIGANATMTLHTGSGPDHPGHAYWERRREVWDNTDWERAVLKTPDGRVVSRWPQVVAEAPVTLAARQPRATPNDPNPDRGSNGSGGSPTPTPSSTPTPTPTPALTSPSPAPVTASSTSAPTTTPAPTPTPTPVVTPTPLVSPTPAPTASPTPVVTPTPSPTATPAASTSAGCVRTVSGFTATAVHAARDGAGAGTVCFPAGTYTGALSASVAGQTWSLAPGAVITGPINVSGAGVTIRGGTIERPTTDRWAPSVRVDADGVTVEGVTFLGGGQVVSIQGNDRTRVRNNTFTGQSGSAIAIWGDGVGADDTLIEGNTITQTITYQVSPITSRGNESNLHAGVQNARTIVRNNTIDQGIGNVGWFGVEFKQSAGTLVEGNTIRGGWVLISFPETDGAIVRNNTLDMRGTPNWGIEVANSHDVTVEGNTFIGGGTSAGDHAVSLNSGSLRTTVRGNTVRDVRTLFDVSGDWHTVTDNCLANVLYEYEYRSSGGPNITFARNGPCG